MLSGESFFSQKWAELNDSIQDNAAFQQIKAKWDELDSKSRSILKIGSLTLVLIFLVAGTIYFYQEVNHKKELIEERSDMVTRLQKSQEELKRLRESNPLSQSQASMDEPWTSFIESKIGAIGIPPDSMKIEPEKVIDHSKEKNSADRPKETEVTGSFKKINVRQMVKLIHQLENGGRPAKVKRIQIETEPDESGYMNLSFTMIGYSFQKK